MPSKIVEQHIACPSCPSSDAYCVYDDGHGYCYACEYFKGNGDTLSDVDCTYEYYAHRGISKESFSIYGARVKIDRLGVPVSVGFLYPNGSCKVRPLKEKSFYWTETKEKVAGCFGVDKFPAGSNKTITITEGEYDAISLYQVLRNPCVSVRSSSSAERDCIHDRDYLSSFERIYLALDNDGPGREAAGRIARLFDYNKIYLVKFSNRKDANEYLQAGESDELRTIWHNSKKYLPENIISSFSDFEKILNEPLVLGIPYPLSTLTEMTYGMRTSESVLITAQEGVGKTELMHAIEHQLLEQTDDNIGTIFLEEPKKRHLQSLAGISLKCPLHLPDHGRPDSDVLDAVKALLKRDERLYLYSHFGCDDPDVLLDTIRFLVTACACRYILLDHITMAVTGLAGEQDERRALDYLSTRLEMMVQELDFGLIVVSHVNDFGQTRGSRYIGKLAHTRIDITRDIANGSNILDVFVSKNRFGQKTGPAGSYAFDPILRTYTEVITSPAVIGTSHIPMELDNASRYSYQKASGPSYTHWGNS